MFKNLKNYISEFHCPYCGSNDVDYIRNCENHDSVTIHKGWQCNICKKKWHEEYKLKKIHDEKFKNEYEFTKKDMEWQI